MIYCINSEKEYNPQQIMEIMGMHVKVENSTGSSEIPKRFIVPVSQYRDKIIRRINDLKTDPIIYVN